MLVKVLVTLQGEVPDTAGDVLTKRLIELGFSDVRGARIGRIIELEMDGAGEEAAANERIKAMCSRVLVNSEIEKYEVLSVEA